MVMAKKIVFEIIADSDSTTLKTWKRVVFRKVSVCVWSKTLCLECSSCLCCRRGFSVFKSKVNLHTNDLWVLRKTKCVYGRVVCLGRDKMCGSGSLCEKALWCLCVHLDFVYCCNLIKQSFSSLTVRNCVCEIQHDIYHVFKYCLLYTSTLCMCVFYCIM